MEMYLQADSIYDWGAFFKAAELDDANKFFSPIIVNSETGGFTRYSWSAQHYSSSHCTALLHMLVTASA